MNTLEHNPESKNETVGLPADLKARLIALIKGIDASPETEVEKTRQLQAIESNDILVLFELSQFVERIYDYRAQKFPEEREQLRSLYEDLSGWLDKATLSK